MGLHPTALTVQSWLGKKKKKKAPRHLAPCTVLLARKCSLLIGLRVTGLRRAVKSQSPCRPGNLRPEACVWPCGREPSGWPWLSQEGCVSSPTVRRGGGSARSCCQPPLSSDDTRLPAAAEPQEARTAPPRGRRGDERWGARKGGWTGAGHSRAVVLVLVPSPPGLGLCRMSYESGLSREAEPIDRLIHPSVRT